MAVVQTVQATIASVWQQVIKFIFQSTLTITLSSIITLFLGLCIPLFILRFLIFHSVKFIRPDLAKMLSAPAQVVAACDKDLANRPMCDLISEMVLSSEIDVPEFLENLSARLKDIWKADPTQYVELRQYYTKWLGYYFWKEEASFSVSKHVIVWNPNREEISDDNLQEIRDQLMNRPYPPEYSPWQVVVVHNYKSKFDKTPNKTVIFAKMHHSFVDGYTGMMLFMSFSNNMKKLKELYSWPQKTKRLSYRLQLAAAFLATPFASACQIATLLYDNLSNFSKLAVVTTESFVPEWQLVDLPMSYIKQIATGLNVGVTSVILSANYAAAKKALEIQGQQLPKFLSLGFPLPWPDHPDKLRNYVTMGAITAPVREADSITRLRVIDKEFKRARASFYTVSNHYAGILVGSLPAWILQQFSNRILSVRGLAITSFPGPKEGLDIFGHEAERFSFFVGESFVNTSIGTFCTTLSYKDVLYINLACYKQIFTKDEANEIKKAMLQEFEVLYKLPQSKNTLEVAPEIICTRL